MSPDVHEDVLWPAAALEAADALAAVRDLAVLSRADDARLAALEHEHGRRVADLIAAMQAVRR